jgi:hypothetical protein
VRSGSLRRMTTTAVDGRGVALGRLRGEGGNALDGSENDAVTHAEAVALRRSAGGEAISNSVVTVWSTEKP